MGRRIEASKSQALAIAKPSLADLAARISDEHQAATSALRQGVLHAIAAGDLLLSAKAQLKHGGWLDWLKANCEIPERTVQAYMRLARLPIEKRNAVADLPLREALSAIRSREQKIADAKERENRPPPGPAVFVRGSDWEKYEQAEPPRAATGKEIADELMRQLDESIYQVRESISVADLHEAFRERFLAPSVEPTHEVAKRVGCVVNHIRRHVDGYPVSESKEFFATLRDAIELLVIAYQLNDEKRADKPPPDDDLTIPEYLRRVPS